MPCLPKASKSCSTLTSRFRCRMKGVRLEWRNQRHLFECRDHFRRLAVQIEHSIRSIPSPLTLVFRASLAAVIFLCIFPAMARECTFKYDLGPGVEMTDRNGLLSSSSDLRTTSTPKTSSNKFSANLHGDQNFKFRFSDNVTTMRIWLGSEQIYEGPPIKSYDATGKRRNPISVEAQWTGKTVSIEIIDECSIGSLLRSFFE
jgi:hypothetical protein